MTPPPRQTAQTRSQSSRAPQSDQGSVLIMILVLIVIVSLMVLPVMKYGTSVLRANVVEAQRTSDSQTAKAGIRLWLSDPADIFNRCDNHATFDPGVQVNGESMMVTCDELEEVGPTEKFGFQVPFGVVATQLGQVVGPKFSGTTSNAATPYPDITSQPWWGTAQSTGVSRKGIVWLPDLQSTFNVGTDTLAKRDTVANGSTGFAMPAAFNCRVYLPGYYPNAVSVTSGNVYFASGIYYFENEVKFSGDADVVVGQGLADFDSGCTDDLQVSANLISPPSIWALDNQTGGATWIFGESGRLVVDNAATTSQLRLRFNQRYAPTNGGGWTSIMTVNGDDTSTGDHVVPEVNRVERSQVFRMPATDVDGDPTNEPLWERTPIAIGQPGLSYRPSNRTYTDRARPPLAPTGLSAAAFQTEASPPSDRAVLLEWNAVTGQAAGGALIDGYTVSGSATGHTLPAGTICLPSDLLVSTSATGNRVSCLVTGLKSASYTFDVAAKNLEGDGAKQSVVVATTSTTPVRAPGAPTNVQVAGGKTAGVANITWTAPTDSGGSPVTKYVVTASQIGPMTPANQPPMTADAAMTLRADVATGGTATVAIPAHDPNGDLWTVTVDTSGLDPLLQPEFTVSTTAGPGLRADVTVTTTANVPPGVYNLPFTVTESHPDAGTRAGTLQVRVAPLLDPNGPPVANAMTLLAAINAPITARVPVTDPDGDLLTLSVDTSGLVSPADWTIATSGLDLTVTTNAADGTYVLPYQVTDPVNPPVAGNITVVVARSVTPVAGKTCEATSSPGVVLVSACAISGMTPLTLGGPVTGRDGYRFDVKAVNGIGASLIAASSQQPYPLAFNGGGTELPAPAKRIVTPWVPEPVIDIKVGGAQPLVFEVNGYVSVPMGRIKVLDPNQKGKIELRGGVIAGSYDIVDPPAVDSNPGSLSIGYAPGLVLQRKVRLTTTVGHIRSVAIVQINRDGKSYGINSLVTQ